MEETTLEPMLRLRRDLVIAARDLSPNEVGFLVDAYYIIQEDRKRSGNQVRAMEEEPHALLAWFFDQNQVLEGQLKRALGTYATSQPVGEWAQSVVGIGPVLAAGLLAHVDVEDPATTVGQKWRFAGLDPTRTWDRGQKRPWNAALKTLCFKIGESFVKVQGHEHDFYGRLFAERKAREVERNRSGELEEQARGRAEELRKLRKMSSASWRWYAGHYPPEVWDGFLALDVQRRETRLRQMDRGEGNGKPMLPPAHIHSRARRWTVKLFLSHYVDVAYQHRHERPLPRPWVLEHGGHVDYIAPPNPPAWWREPNMA